MSGPKFSNDKRRNLRGSTMSHIGNIVNDQDALGTLIGIQPEAPNSVESLWTVQDTATYLQKSPRWIFYALRLPDDMDGSIPHIKLGRNPRFIPDDIRSWARMGFPSVKTFREWIATK